MITTRALLIPVALLVATMTPALAQADTPSPGDIPDNQAFVSVKTASFSVVAPEGWAKTTSGKRITLADKYNAIRLDLSATAKAPTIRSVTATELPKLRSTTPGFRSPKVTSVTRPAGAVVLVRYQARSRKDAVTGRTVVNDVERYEFWKGGRLVVVTLEAPHGSDNVDPWRKVTESFRWR
jgi:hypothetical protein